MSLDRLKDALDRAAASGRRITFWVRDDDAVEPTEQLEKLLSLTEHAGVPLTLAAIPAGATRALAARIEDAAHVSVAVHGWNHQNHAPEGEKNQELGLHREQTKVVQDIAAGLARIRSMFGPRSVAMLVPPWNRIHPELLSLLPTLGFAALSVFGREVREAPVSLLNTHVDIIDWKGTRGGRPSDVLFAEVVRRMELLTDDPLDTVGILTHHLVHDAAAWRFLELLFEHTADHPGCRWMRSEDVLARAGR